MSCNLVKEAHKLFHIPPAPKELDFDSWAKYLVTKARHDKSCEQQAAAQEHWIEREKVLELEREMERVRLELERKKKEEEEEKEKKLAKAAKKKVTAVIEVLIDDCWGCDACLQVGKSLFVSCENSPLLIVDSEGAVCSCADTGPGAACLSCCKIKKHCNWIVWNATKAVEASTSTMNMVPGPSSVGESSSGTTHGHRSRPSVEALKEISAKIHAFCESYEAGHKVDEEQIAHVEHWARIVEWHTTMAIDSI